MSAIPSPSRAASPLPGQPPARLHAPCPALPATDLDHVLRLTAPLWEETRGAVFFVTGGTGFVGTWMLESLLHANRALGLDVRVRVLTRDPARFAARLPQVARAEEVTVMAGDMAHFGAGAETGRFDFGLHLASETRPEAPEADPVDLFERNIEGTRSFVRVARAGGARRALFTSSGAVYGTQPPGLAHIGEEHRVAPDPVLARSAYGESKRASEFLVAQGGDGSRGLGMSIARLFAFVGPQLPLEGAFAAGNFIRDALAGGPLVVKGDGTPFRSYLYAADLAVWLWTILLRGRPAQAYNVGSEQAVSIRSLAEEVIRVCPTAGGLEIRAHPVPGAVPIRYVPSTRKAREELGLAETVGLTDALTRSLAWHRDARVAARGLSARQAIEAEG